MVRWIAKMRPARVVDPGCGTGRFAVAAARAMPETDILALDSDPVAALLCRAWVRRLGLANVQVRCADFLTTDIPPIQGCTAFVGNPPYVRHHRLSSSVKAWARQAARDLHLPFSALSGLHAYFFLATAMHARPGDVGCYITSAEWLDVKYGETIRRLLADHLGLMSISMLHESETAFQDAMTTAAITCFNVGHKRNTVRLSIVPRFRSATGPSSARRAKLGELNGRWSEAFRKESPAKVQSNAAPLGSLFAVHRGIATGANRFFVMTATQAEQMGLSELAHPVVCRGREVFEAEGVLQTPTQMRLILVPKDIDRLPYTTKKAVQRYLHLGEERGVDSRYLCCHRDPWWWLGVVRRPPIVASYMARRPPAFALNPNGRLILNIAHGLYPRHRMSRSELLSVVRSLNTMAPEFAGRGRRYHGGLEKFEPREMEDLTIPTALTKLAV